VLPIPQHGALSTMPASSKPRGEIYHAAIRTGEVRSHWGATA